MRPLTRGLLASAAAATLFTPVLAPGGPALAAGPQLTSRPHGASFAAADHGAREQVGRPIVIGHRGAAGYRPEHTLAGYRLAIAMGADFIEPDLVSTKDGYLVDRHENDITDTTDVAEHPEFADLRTSKVVDGTRIRGWFTEDFTLAQLRTLRAVERLPGTRPDNTVYDGRFRVPTFEQVLDLLERQEALTGRNLGIYPEIKHSTYFRSIGLPLERRVVQRLAAHDLDSYRSKVYIQSFETKNLRMLNTMTSNKLVQLLDSTGAPYDFVASGDPRTYADLVEPSGLAWIATYADGIGPSKDWIIPRNSHGFLVSPTTVVADAHLEGLLVHAFTFRSENAFLPSDFRIGDNGRTHGEALAEVLLYLQQGLDGFFTDFPDTGRKARDLYVG